MCSPIAPITRIGPTTATVDTPGGPAAVTVRHSWDLRTRINTTHRHWALPSGDEARDKIPRRVLFPQELERCAEVSGFEVLDMSDGTRKGLTGPAAYTVARRAQR
ncbi:hypothetical protein ACIP88_25735 [Streptomyces uncialis]|uniref:hypothetical protein n=1 Tax=Streptomyces uncialis TaxID=1048205 RepID=UPI003802841C